MKPTTSKCARRTGRPKTKTRRAQFVFAADVDKLLVGTAQRLHRTQTSIVEQLVRQFCSVKNLVG